jgi:hypothetical protein
MPKRHDVEYETEQLLESIEARILTEFGDAYRKNVPGFSVVLNASQGRTLDLTIGLHVDLSESRPQAKLKFRYSQVVTDVRDIVFEDPKQVLLGIDAEPPAESHGQPEGEPGGQPLEPEAGEGPVTPHQRRNGRRGKKAAATEEDEVIDVPTEEAVNE